MIWPAKETCARIASLWARATGSAFPGESQNAWDALKRIQTEFALDEVELIFIAEFWAKEPAGTHIRPGQTPERSPNVLELVMAQIETHSISLTLAQQIMVALWILHTHIFDQFVHTPRLALRSTEPGCGKTLLLMFMKQLVGDARYTSHTSPAVIYHRLRKRPRTTFLLDEIENSSLWSNNKLLLNLFDAGHRQGGCITRVVKNEEVEYPCFAPLALAAVSKMRFPPQLLSRSIIIDMKKDPNSRDRLSPHDAYLAAAYRELSEWAVTFRRPQNVKIPFTARDADNYYVLIEIADTLGYGSTAYAAALALHRPNEDPAVRLLLDTYTIFEQRNADRIWTSEYLDALYNVEGSAWSEFWGLTDNEDPHKLRRGELLRMLRTKGIRSRAVWRPADHEQKRRDERGFLREQFEPVWARHFGTTPPQSNKIIQLTRQKNRH
jgi:hypothetical protein